MSTLLVDKITVGGSNSYGGGLAYNLNVDVSKDTGPTKATLTVVNQNGVYDDIALSTTSLTTIAAGNFSIKMCPIAYKVTERAGNKIMTVTFEDGSIILDKMYVGLLGEFMTITQQRVYKGTIQYFSDAKSDWETYTNDCPYILTGGGTQSLPGNIIIVGQEIIDPRNPCGTNNTKYTLNQLFNAIIAKGINVIPFASNNHYYQQYIGTLRQVLTSWCSDYGYGFYWENDTLKFLNLSQMININAVQPDTTETLSYGKTLEGSYKQIGIAAWRKGQEIKSNSSSSYRLLFFRCLKLTDLLGPSLGEQMEIEAVLSAFCNGLRDYYVINHLSDGLDRLGIQTQQEFFPGSPFYEAVKKDLSTSQGTFPYSTMLTSTTGKLVRCTYDQGKKNAMYAQAFSMAHDFIGKYYITNQALVEKVDTTYFTQSSTIKGGRGFSANFIPSDSDAGSIDPVFNNIAALANQNQTLSDFVANAAGNPAAGSWLFKRTGIWNPASSTGIVAEINNYLNKNKLVPINIGFGVLTDTTLALLSSAIDDSDTLFFIPDGNASAAAISITYNYEANLAETDTVSINSAAWVEAVENYNTCEGCIKLHEKKLRDQLGYQFQSRVGLLSNGSAPTVTIGAGSLSLVLQAPSQADYQAIEVIQRTRRIEIPKIDNVKMTGNLIDGDYVEARVLQKNATLDYILNVPANFGGVLDISKIRVAEKSGTQGDSDTYEFLTIDAYLNLVLQNISHGSEGPAHTKEIREAGYPSMNPSPADGLTNMTVEYTDAGVYTTYKFSSRPKVIQPLELIATKIKTESLPSNYLRQSL